LLDSDYIRLQGLVVVGALKSEFELLFSREISLEIKHFLITFWFVYDSFSGILHIWIVFSKSLATSDRTF